MGGGGDYEMGSLLISCISSSCAMVLVLLLLLLIIVIVVVTDDWFITVTEFAFVFVCDDFVSA